MGGFSMTPDVYSYDPFEQLPSVAGEALGFASVLFGIFAVVYLVALVFGIVLYVLQSIGIYAVAKRRGINNPWLAWIPVGVLWILGSISDQYQYVVKGRVRNRRKTLLGVSIAVFACLLVEIIAAVVLVVAAVIGENAVAAGIGGIVMLLLYLAVLVMAIILLVFTYIAMYDLYVSCDPSNATTYLVLSIVFNITQPFFMFFSRKKDYGMPPRKAETQPEPQLEPAAEETPVADAPIVEEVPIAEETPEVTE